MNKEKIDARFQILIDALQEIKTHWACQYDHPKKLSPMYSGPYGIGVTDGHRCAANIAEAALNAFEAASNGHYDNAAKISKETTEIE